jgi:hypothetical protein
VEEHVKKIAIAALALGALATTFVTPASAAAPSDTDLGCGFTSVTDPNPEAPVGTQTGYIDGGPILQNGTITCTIQVGGATHADANNGASASATGTNGFTYLSPTLVSYSSPPLTPVYLCTQFNDGSVTYYWDDTTGTWTTSASSTCGLAISGGTSDPVFDPIFDLIDTILDLLTTVEKDVIDPAVCPVLATLAGSYGPITINAQGDIFINGEAFWDCPPYDLFG